MALTATDSSIYELLNDRMYIVPENQRQYVWNQNNWQELLDDIKLVIEGNPHAHFIGSIVLKEETVDDGIKNHFSIIDGQQRISTLTIALCAIGLIFAELGEQGLFGGLKKNILVKDIRDIAHPIFSFAANKDIAQLVEQLVEQVELRFSNQETMISCEELMKVIKVRKIIKDCFIFFYTQIKNDINDDAAQLTKYLKTIQDIKYIDIVAKSDEDAFSIFEILNARGQPLKDFELLRNYLLKYTIQNEKTLTKDSLEAIEELLEKDVELFLKHYAMHRYGEKTDKGEKRPYKIIIKKEKNKDVKLLLADLLKKAQYYNKIITYQGCSDLEKKIFSFFKPRRQQQFRPIVLSLMHRLELGDLSQNQYDEAISFLYEFFIYFNVIGEQTSNKIEDIVYEYSAKIENSFTDTTISKMRKSMSRRIPNEENFYSSIKNVRYSHHWKAFSGSKKLENVRAIFEIIEKEYGYTGDFNNDAFTIEHILPDSLTENNAVIGNLMLLEKDINEDCDNKDLSKKVALYGTSALFLPKLVNADEFDIEERTKWISDTLYSYIKKLKNE